MHFTHSTIGLSLFGAGVFIGICVLAWCIWDQIEKARERQARREFDDTLAGMSSAPPQSLDYENWDGVSWDAPEPGWEFEPRWQEQPLAAYTQSHWPPAGEASRHFFGTDLVQYDPAADSAEYMRKMDADTTAFIARITGEIPVAA